MLLIYEALESFADLLYEHYSATVYPLGMHSVSKTSCELQLASREV